MKVFLNIIKGFFTAVGWILLLILFLLIFPVRADILLEDAVLHLDLKYLLFKFRILPAKDKAGKSRKKEKSGKEDAGETKDASPLPDTDPGENTSDRNDASGKDAGMPMTGKKTEGKKIGDKRNSQGTSEKGSKEKSVGETVSKIISLIRRISQPGYWAVRMLLRAVHIKDFSVVVCVTGDDPASVGFRSGIQWSLIGSFMNTINRLFGKNVTYGEVTVLPCFNGVDERKEKLSCSISTQPIIILLIVLGFGLGYLTELIKDLISRGGKKNVN